MPGMLDFAVNVRAAEPPFWLAVRLGDLGRYPVAEAEPGARRLASLRQEMVVGLRVVGLTVTEGVAPFVLFTVP